MKSGHSNSSLSFENKMTLPFTGIAGYSAWGGDASVYQASACSPVTLPCYIHDKWNTTIRTKNHMNGVDVINTLSNTWGAWKHGMEKGRNKDSNQVEAVEMQAYISSNKELVVGYVRNRTFNVYTEGVNNSDCKQIGYDNNGGVKDYSPIDSLTNFHWDDVRNSEQIKVDGVKILKTYNVDFYNLNQYISTDNKLSSIGGKLKLRYPELYIEEPWQNRPVVWFVAKIEGYNEMIQSSDITEGILEALSERLLANAQDTLYREYLLNVHPNPFEDYLTIESPVNDEITIQEASGRIVLKQKISKGKNRIQTRELTNGMYFVHFVDKSQTFKLIKE